MRREAVTLALLAIACGGDVTGVRQTSDVADASRGGRSTGGGTHSSGGAPASSGGAAGTGTRSTGGAAGGNTSNTLDGSLDGDAAPGQCERRVIQVPDAGTILLDSCCSPAEFRAYQTKCPGAPPQAECGFDIIEGKISGCCRPDGLCGASTVGVPSTPQPPVCGTPFDFPNRLFTFEITSFPRERCEYIVPTDGGDAAPDSGDSSATGTAGDGSASRDASDASRAADQ